MKKTVSRLLAALIVCLSVMCFTACVNAPDETVISQESARLLMMSYLDEKGFDEENDTLAEGENADRLFGMYAVSYDGKNFYEYQSARDEWIKDMNEE